ncbi:MAG TPA: hypothetical protein VFX70_00685 [Mycobacteriales bacterium]|nr:hypothetical protein [Mycobacteriales bacterium]
MSADLSVLVAGADRDELARVVRAVAAMHEPDRSERCRWCHPPARWWRRRRPDRPCTTRRVIVAELSTNGPPRWRSA